MRTRSLKYEAGKRELRTADAVEIEGPQLRVEGTGLIVDLDGQRLQVLHQVTTTLSQTEGKGLFRIGPVAWKR
jgi:lipopolysaccharide export system protein LptC